MARQVLLAIVTAMALVLTSAPAPARSGEPTVHRVYAGQHLGMIAKRYHVTVEAICQANGIGPRTPIRPGQQLLIPPPDDRDGSRTAKVRKQRAQRPAKPSPARAAARSSSRTSRAPRVHEVYPRQHLGMIAKRYRVSVQAIRHANDLERGTPIRPGQELVIPWPEDTDGSQARRHARDRSKRRAQERSQPKRAGRKGKRNSWQAYRRPPWRKGFVELQGRTAAWRGYVVGRNGKVLGAARKAFSRLLATSDGRTIKIHPRLIRLLAKVSDTFGGRPIRIVSGFRLESTARRSRHKTGHALDFSIPGVPNRALRDYVKTFSRVGVGYYPNSHFIHLDVRDRSTYWVDYSGPGQPPRYGGVWAKGARKKK